MQNDRLIPVYRVSQKVSLVPYMYYTHCQLLSVMGVLRMIKLFGWETRVTEIIAEKREDELKWIWKRRLLLVGNSCVK